MSMWKRAIALGMTMGMLISSMPVSAYADEMMLEDDTYFVVDDDIEATVVPEHVDVEEANYLDDTFVSEEEEKGIDEQAVVGNDFDEIGNDFIIDSGDTYLYAAADNTEYGILLESGVCGNPNIFWDAYDENGDEVCDTLVISGTGYENQSRPELYSYADQIQTAKTVIIEEGIKGFGTYGLYKAYNVEQLIFPSTLQYLGDECFEASMKLSGTVVFPESLTYIGNLAFKYSDAKFVFQNSNCEIAGQDYNNQTFSQKATLIGYSGSTAEAYAKLWKLSFIPDHYYEIIEQREKTCENDGVIKKKCLICNDEKTDIIPASHDWGEGIITKEADCHNEGIMRYTCSTCGSIQEEIIPITHTWDNGFISKQANCTDIGEKTYTCVYCSATHTEEVPVDKNNHIWDDGVITREPTYSSTGQKQFTCLLCGSTRTETIPKKDYGNIDDAMEASVDATIYSWNWTTTNCTKGFYTSVELPQDGVLYINASKPKYSGKTGYILFTVYNKNKEPIWRNDSLTACSDGESWYEPIIGLPRGRYYIRMQAVVGGSATSQYFYKFAPYVYHELEPNETKEQATYLSLNNACFGAYGCDSSSTDFSYALHDYYVINLDANKRYEICVKGMDEIKKTLTQIEVIDPSDSSQSIRYGITNLIDEDGYNYICYETTMSGKYYIHFDNNSIGRQCQFFINIREHSHKWDNGTVTTKPTTSAAGIKTFTCTDCGETETEEIPMLPTSGVTDEGLSWAVADGVLTISLADDAQSTEIPDYASADDAPWAEAALELSVSKIVVEEGITKIGSNAFKGMNSLKEIDLPRSLTELAEDSIKESVLSTVKINYAGSKSEWDSLTQGTAFNDVEITSTHTHTWDSGEVTVPATTTSEGVRTYRCACGETKTETIPKLSPSADNPQVNPGTDPGTTPGTTPQGNPGTDAAPEVIAEQITISKKPTIKKPSATKNKITVNWKHFKKTKKTQSIWKKIKKVQIQCATDKAFTNIVKTATVGKSKTKATIKGLAKKTNYYVRVRYFDGTGYSKWSSVKKIKTKK